MARFNTIKGYKGLYKISTDGLVYSIRNKINLKPNLIGNGYESVILCKDKIQERACVHRLVAEKFIPNTNNKPQVNHIDGNKLNNCVDNLEWCTAKENLYHARENGLINQNGEDSSSAKLTNEDVVNIRRLYSKGFFSQKLIANKYNVTQSNINKIVNNKTFK